MNNFSIKTLKSESLESGVSYGTFLIDFLKPGQGITIGNQLRRTLLNELGNVAISAIRITGINHEFSLIPGVREDILEILLNLKGVVFKSKTKVPQLARLKIQGPGVVTAGCIELPPELEIVNPNHYLMTIATLQLLEIEIKLEYGIGYKLASQTFIENENNFLQLDRTFMPVQKVNFTIENLYDKKNNLTERVIFDIYTDGSISPNEAFDSSIKLTIDLFTSLLKSNKDTKIKKESFALENTFIKPYTNLAIEELQLSVRSYNCLKKAQINTVGDLLNYSSKRLQKLKNFGQKSSDEVFYTLKNKLGIILK